MPLSIKVGQIFTILTIINNDCTALLAWRFVVVKWRYIKYEAFYLFYLYRHTGRQRAVIHKLG